MDSFRHLHPSLVLAPHFFIHPPKMFNQQAEQKKLDHRNNVDYQNQMSVSEKVRVREKPIRVEASPEFSLPGWQKESRNGRWDRGGFCGLLLHTLFGHLSGKLDWSTLFPSLEYNGTTQFNPKRKFLTNIYFFTVAGFLCAFEIAVCRKSHSEFCFVGEVSLT